MKNRDKTPYCHKFFHTYFPNEWKYRYEKKNSLILKKYIKNLTI